MTILCILQTKNNIVISNLEHGFAKISKWFYESYMVLNADIFNFLTVGFNEAIPEIS